MRTGHRVAAGLLAAVSLVIVGGGCDDAEKQVQKATNNIGEFALRNASSIAGSAKFSDAGYPLSKRLTCTATVDDTSKTTRATVSCTGTTKDGKPVTLEGTAQDEGAKKGSYVGKVEGKDVFSDNCLAC